MSTAPARSARCERFGLALGAARWVQTRGSGPAQEYLHEICMNLHETCMKPA
jgi:hypothetical protein